MLLLAVAPEDLSVNYVTNLDQYECTSLVITNAGSHWPHKAPRLVDWNRAMIGIHVPAWCGRLRVKPRHG